MLRSFEDKEQALPSWEGSVAEDWLGKWAMNQMLINVAKRKFARSVRLPAALTRTQVRTTRAYCAAMLHTRHATKNRR